MLYLQKVISRKTSLKKSFVGVLKVNDEKSMIRIWNRIAKIYLFFVGAWSNGVLLQRLLINTLLSSLC
jgi:hypothetical protein